MRTPTTRLLMAGAAIAAALATTGCGSKSNIPSTFEVIGETSTDLGIAIVLRDTGTGCEMVAISNVGIMPRNERSADGSAVKQRCVLTGDEQPAPGGTGFGSAPATGGGSGQPSFVPAPNPVGTEAQEQAVRDAIRAQAQGAIPPAGPAETPSIPPPKGGTRTTPVAPEGDGVESQLKQ